MSHNQESLLNQFLEGVCELSLQILPFEGAAIALYDPDKGRLKASGAAGIFDSENFRKFIASGLSLGSADHKQWFIQDATQAFVNGQEVVGGESLIQNVSLPDGEQARVADKITEVEKEGTVKFNYELYKNGKQPLTAICLPLRRTKPPLNEFLGLFILNNPVLPPESRDKRIDYSILFLAHLFTRWASMFLTELTTGKLGQLRLPRNGEELLQKWHIEKNYIPPIDRTIGFQMRVINWVELSGSSLEIFIGSMVAAVVLIGFLCFLMVSNKISWWVRFYISFLVSILIYEVVLVGREFWRHWKEKE